jgi:hypothetical protein
LDWTYLLRVGIYLCTSKWKSLLFTMPSRLDNIGDDDKGGDDDDDDDKGGGDDDDDDKGDNDDDDKGDNDDNDDEDDDNDDNDDNGGGVYRHDMQCSQLWRCCQRTD